jgi:hypothetical protein
VYAATRREDTALRPVRLDIAGFVGVALRGPVDTPVVLRSWSDYERRFGGFERPDNGPDRLLPYAVQAFFAQGGSRAYAVRVAPPPNFVGPTATEATAGFAFDVDPVPRWQLAAANEGPWGTALSIQLDFEVAQTFPAGVREGLGLTLPPGTDPLDCSLVRIRRRDLPPTGVFRWLRRTDEPGRTDRSALLDRSLPEAEDGTEAIEVDVITGTLVVSEPSAPSRGEERMTGLGLSPGHARFIATVVDEESELVRTIPPWDEPLAPDRFLVPRRVTRTREGLDRSYGIGHGSFFDDGAAGDDPLDEGTAHRGADAMGRVQEVGILCVPDLMWRAERPSPRPPPSVRVRPRSHCDACAPPDPESPRPEVLPIPVGLDGRNRVELAEIVNRQQRLVEIADLRRRFVVLLDVPRGLPVRSISDWRTRFDSGFAAAYHPWLGVPRPPADGGGLVDVGPSNFAAGIVSAREQRQGLPWGPANEIAQGAVRSAEVITDAVHDHLHLLGVNVYRTERDGFRLSAARTLSRDPEYRQLSVRRLMTMLALTLERQTQWLVFEPNTVALRDRLTHTVTQLLRELYRRGSFAGRTEGESYFVKCDSGLNPTESQRQGQLLAEVGVAPASPLEYLVLMISQDVDGNVSVGA